MQVAKYLKPVTPPILWHEARKLLHAPSSEKGTSHEAKADELFNGHDNLFKKTLKNSRVYGEYGCGASTSWVLRNTSAQVISVETDPSWAEQIKADAVATERLSMHLIDLGPVGAWGRPRDYRKRKNFKAYAAALWQEDSCPDTILIDGRFRVFSFLTCLLRALPGTVLIFDDYIKRPWYHIVEEIINVSENNQRQALFQTPEFSKADKNYISSMREKFEFVID